MSFYLLAINYICNEWTNFPFLMLSPKPRDAFSQVKTNKASNTRIILDTNLRRWFSRNLGLWKSRRQYFFEDEDVLNVDMLLRVQKFSDKGPGDSRYLLTWWPDKENDFFQKKPNFSKEGSTKISISGHQLCRSSSYLGDSSPVVSNIRQVDEHELIFESNFKNWDIIEHARLIDQDRYRSRYIYSWQNNILKIAESHHEIKLEEDSGLIQD